MVAFHYPPQTGSSGVQRSLKFAQYLPQFGWEPTVLTAHPRAYARIDDSSVAQQDGVKVHRAFALDASRHLAIKGRYLQMTALPDRWMSWWAGAVPLGLRLARAQKFDAIWSTYPIATAHMIAGTLHRRTGIPWIADFRDPMTEPGFPPDPRMHQAYSRIERATIAACTRAVFTTPGSREASLRKFPSMQAERFEVIENGYDEEDFAAASAATRTDTERFLLLHSGIVYPSERDPRPLFEALADLRRAGLVSAASFVLVLRASAHENTLQAMIDRLQIADLVVLRPPLPYSEALSEMLSADGLLLLQAANCNNQIPAKLYEYLRAGRPILALTDPVGDTASTMRAAGLDSIARLDCKIQIAAAILEFMQRVRDGHASLASAAVVQGSSRQGRTRDLARVLDDVIALRAV
ncbi:MAG: glycosyltransferase [Herminiimonas sp.]|nr:glycosyltransferase [Herminiimonas sp.]